MNDFNMLELTDIPSGIKLNELYIVPHDIGAIKLKFDERL